jgi:lipoprotein NlpI
VRRVRGRCHAAIVAALVAVACSGAAAQPARQVLDRAMADFQAGRIAASIEGFDRVVALQPDSAPYLWQRGIALYYAGRFGDCRAQFESHRAVNPNDVENATWHFLCVARAESPQAAVQKMLPVGPDARVPMREIYQMYLGKLTEAQVLSAAGRSVEGQFYAQLYIGLYREARGDITGAREAIARAADPKFAAAGGYMHDVARVHAERAR